MRSGAAGRIRMASSSAMRISCLRRLANSAGLIIVGRASHQFRRRRWRGPSTQSLCSSSTATRTNSSISLQRILVVARVVVAQVAGARSAPGRPGPPRLPPTAAAWRRPPVRSRRGSRDTRRAGPSPRSDTDTSASGSSSSKPKSGSTRAGRRWPGTGGPARCRAAASARSESARTSRQPVGTVGSPPPDSQPHKRAVQFAGVVLASRMARPGRRPRHT